jgi:hypothetical protein
MQRVENIIGATTVVTSLLYVRGSADPADLLFFAFAVAVCGITSSYSELHGYKFRYALLGPAILPCLLLVTAAVRVRCLCLGLVLVWIMRSALIGFWYKVALVGALCYWILAFLPLGYASVDVLSLVIAGLYGALHTATDLTHTEKVFVSLGMTLMLRWNYQLLTTNVRVLCCANVCRHADAMPYRCFFMLDRILLRRMARRIARRCKRWVWFLSA